jgi:ribonuclease PH
VLAENPIISNVAAISVGIVNGTPVLDLKYTEDSAAEVDMNVVMNGEGKFVEVQGTGEEATYTRKELNEMLDLAEKGLKEIMELQNRIIGE